MSREGFLGSAYTVTHTDDDVNTKEGARKFIIEQARSEGCVCNPDIQFDKFDVKGREILVETTIVHEAFCKIKIKKGRLTDA